MKKLFLLLVFLGITNYTYSQWIQTNGPYGSTIQAITTNDGYLIAGSRGGNIYRSSDYGESWSVVNVTDTLFTSFANISSNLFAGTGRGVFVSTNSGSNWNATTLTYHITSLAVIGTNLYASTYGGVFISSDNGASWNAFNTGLTDLKVNSLAAKDNDLYAATYEGVFLSKFNGSWQKVYPGTFYSATVYSLAVLGSNIFAGLEIPFGTGVYRSTDNGSNWTFTSQGIPSNETTYYMMANGDNLFGVISDNYGIYLSTNNGENWKEVAEGLSNKSISSIATDDKYLYVGTWWDGMVWKRPVWDFIPQVNVDNPFIYLGKIGIGTSKDIAINISNDSFVDLSIQSISSSNNSFVVKTPELDIPARNSKDIIVMFRPTKPGLDTAHIIITSNSGTSPDTLTTTGFGAVYTIELSPLMISMGAVEVGQTKDTIFTLTNTGNDTLRIADISCNETAFSFDPSQLIIPPGSSKQDTIFFTPEKEGEIVGEIRVLSNAFSSPDSVIISANGLVTNVRDSDEIPNKYSLSQNYPNPFNPSTLIKFQVPKLENVTLKIYDMLGKEIHTLIDSEIPAGFYEIEFNAENLSSGVYFYKMQSGNFIETKKLILLK